MDRAYSVLEVKSIDVERRRITGIASTPRPDRAGDIFEPAGATFAAEVPLLLHHDKQRPVGVARLTVSAGAILFDAELPQVETPGPLRDRLEETWQGLTSVPPLIRGTSIGFRPLRDGIKPLKAGGLHFLKSEICELSLVTIPQNVDATVLTVKSADASYLPVEKTAMTTAEQIVDCENRRTLAVTRMTAILESDKLDETRQKEYDACQAEVTDLDARLPRLRAFEKTLAASATPVSPAFTASTPTTPRITVKSNLPPGTGFVRYCKAMLAARGNRFEAIEIAKEWHDTPEVELILRAASSPATTTNVPWAGALVPGLTHMGSEFIEL